MKRAMQLILICALPMGSGCQDTNGHDHVNESHEDQASHELHANDEHNHDQQPHMDEVEGHEDRSHGEEGSEELLVRISPQAQSTSGIRLGIAESGVLTDAIEVPAEVQLNPDRVAHISPLVEGQLLSVDVTLGDQVETKTQLAKLRSVELGQARAELSRTNSLRNVAEQNRDRQRRLRKEGISSKRSLLEAELAYKQADAERDAARSHLRVFGLRGGSGPDMTLESPITGVVVERHATRGENVSPQDTLFIVADLSRVWVIGRVYEQQIAQAALGMSATLTLNAYPSRHWTGTVDFVGTTLDESTRTLPVRVELDNPDGRLRPGLFGSLRLASTKPAPTSVVLPLSSIQILKEQTVVFTPGDEEGEFVVHPVTLGKKSARLAEVLTGLEPGAQVVVEGAFILKSELMRGELGHGHAH
ncbi:MAG: efflux RND transporter periplasmic adaptor subunit [Bradymonadia bacterium]